MRTGYCRRRWRALPANTDPMASVGYLVAAAAITIAGLIGYGVVLARRLQEAREERRELQR
jgi:hypothetical protein